GRRALDPVRARLGPEWIARSRRALARVRRRGRDSSHLHVPPPVQRRRRPARVERGRHAAPRLRPRPSVEMGAPAGGVALWILAVGLVLVGIVGTVLPGVPGAILVLAGLLLAAWIDGFARVAVGTLGGLAVLTLITYALDFVATVVGARRFGTSWWGILGALVGLLGSFPFGFAGFLVGPFLGAFAAELIARRDVRQAGRAGLGAWLGLLLGTAGRLALVLAMVGIFIVAYLR